MRVSNLAIVLFMVLVLADAALAATLHGNIYDIELNELNNVVVEVDSEPKQRYVSKDGAYTFELNPGDYTITANYSLDELHEYTTTEDISITEEGDYVYDLFLFPGFDAEDEELLKEPDIVDVSETVVDENGGVSGITIAIIAVIAVIALLLIYYFVGRRKEKEQKKEIKEVEKVEKQAKGMLKKKGKHREGEHKKEKRRTRLGERPEEVGDADLEKVIEIIKKEGGRTTQKELRKQIPLSEAKISLMISELEHKKIVQKVKKGRGNIIILKKR